ncbi:OmcA/MtrC family decaheme c-type cytochrome [Shewanella yunxiaonensis]|uniref:OmcA/MtrC family decaheme c-type cytochrome n=1 Tax=Shewanella yunxiaonensis TaxID=2829809 RepID=A0ABX7YVX3_9GAMM|nr:OmcA/MtrC family decaheme c-type cytochrome [Shewanella yunxiaonensis]QUN06962.1 OmcA/MtrC family decaheme c-type cytochrome [Shewanella yunxiaonensis]
MMKNHNKSLLALFLVGLFGLSACTFDGSDGKDGVDGTNGTNGTNGTDGTNGTNGLDAGSVVSTVYKANDVTITIDPASSTLAGSGAFALKFTATAKNQAGEVKPLTGISELRIASATAVTNTTDNGPAVYWQNNSKAAGNSSTYMYCSLTGAHSTTDACTLVEDATNPGTYTGTWAHDGTAPIMYAADDLNAPHRIFMRLSNITDADGNALPDNVLSTTTYVPATGEVGVESGKDTVANQACMNCHGESVTTGGIAASVGHKYQNVQNCVVCHNPGLVDAANEAKGYIYDLPAMIHRIHGGKDLADYGLPQGPNWAEIVYPAPLAECTQCHSTDEGKTTWETPNRAACSGCHSGINWTTGEGHSEYTLAQADDSQCASCHSTGALAPINAHKVGKRAEYASLVTVDFTGATAAVSATDSTMKTLTLTVKMTINGAPVTDASTLVYSSSNTNGVIKKDSVIIGNVDDSGRVTAWRDVSGAPTITLAKFKFDANGVGTYSSDVPATVFTTSTLYVGTEDNFCADNGAAVTCGNTDAQFGASNPIGVTSTVKFFSIVDGVAAVTARMADPARITVAESKCDACHSSLDYAKGANHGVYTFDQCMQCHNDTHAGSGHAAVSYLDEDGTTLVPTGVTFANRDLVTVAHRLHSGNFGESEGIVLHKDGSVTGFPGVQGDCSACHKDGVSFFAADGGLTSGKRSIAVTGGYVSPVAESCRSCHTSASALAHFQTNGATTSDAPDSSSNLPIESCATCHAQGKTFGIDQFHVIK